MTAADSEEMRRTAVAIQDRMVEVCRLALERLEPAEPVWAVGEVDEAVNRRERTSAAIGTILGWNPELQLDRQVTALQLRRPDESAVATLVSFGCHPVTTGYDMDVYSADFPGPLRSLVRSVTGGECVFLQGAAGNVLPRVAFTQDEREAERLGRRVALEALHALADRHAGARRVVRGSDGSVTPIALYRIERVAGRRARARRRSRARRVPAPAAALGPTSSRSSGGRPRRRSPTPMRAAIAEPRRWPATPPAGRAGPRPASSTARRRRRSTARSTRSASATA